MPPPPFDFQGLPEELRRDIVRRLDRHTNVGSARLAGVLDDDQMIEHLIQHRHSLYPVLDDDDAITLKKAIDRGLDINAPLRRERHYIQEHLVEAAFRTEHGRHGWCFKLLIRAGAFVPFRLMEHFLQHNDFKMVDAIRAKHPRKATLLSGVYLNDFITAITIQRSGRESTPAQRNKLLRALLDWGINVGDFSRRINNRTGQRTVIVPCDLMRALRATRLFTDAQLQLVEQYRTGQRRPRYRALSTF